MMVGMSFVLRCLEYLSALALRFDRWLERMLMPGVVHPGDFEYHFG